jgi:hypothetical protein
VKTVSLRSTITSTGFETKLRPAFRMSAPGRRCASHRIWKPLQMPSTGPPSAAWRWTACMMGLNRAMAPERR